MSPVMLSPPPLSRPLLDGACVTAPWRAFFQELHALVYGQGFDKVDAAHAAALAATPGSAQVVALGGLQGGGPLADNATVTLYRAIDLVANLPASGVNDGDWAFAQNGRKPGEAGGAGTGVPCFWSGGSWVAVTSGATVTS